MPDSSISNNTNKYFERDIWGGEVHPEALPKPKVKAARRFTQDEVIEALRNARGLKTMAAKQLGCRLRTIEEYCERYEAVQGECDAQLQAVVDTAHLQLIAAVNRGEWRAIEFTLRTLGKSLGFSERHEVTGKDGAAIAHTHIHLWEERLQHIHDKMAAKKAAIQLEREAGGGYARPVDTA